jgi:hypothetical protein
MADIGNLLKNLANNPLTLLQNGSLPTKNFYIFGHGNASESGTLNDDSYFHASDIANTLHNRLLAGANGVWNRSGQAYRLVFIDSCYSAFNKDFAHAFGIYDRITTANLAHWPEQVQAFVGWTGEKKEPGGVLGDKRDCENCYSVFWSAWQSGLPLETCIELASQDHPRPPLDFLDLSAFNFGPHYQHWNVYQYRRYGITGTSYLFLKIYGYAGITRTGFKPGYDNSSYYKF